MQIGMDYKFQQFDDFSVCLFADIGFFALVVGNFKPTFALFLDIISYIAVFFLYAPQSIFISSAFLYSDHLKVLLLSRKYEKSALLFGSKTLFGVIWLLLHFGYNQTVGNFVQTFSVYKRCLHN